MALDRVNDHASSVDPREAARYAALAETWWDKTGPFWPLHRLNELRVQYIRNQLCSLFQRDPAAARPLSGLRILDIGCGGGILSEAMVTLGAEVQGIDVVERNIAVARYHAGQSGLAIPYETVTAETLARQGIRYDVVLNMEVVEHVADLPGFVHACAQLVKPDGIMFIATINRTLLSWLTTIIGAEYLLRWLPRGTHQWRRFPKPRELEELLERDGMQLIARCGVRVNPFTRRMALTRFMSVNYMLVLKRNADRTYAKFSV
jgi:2-polyprenyl-6-hydroxyphenyl methylase/3-demethylubiquinone-9 3-methyltransferase